MGERDDKSADTGGGAEEAREVEGAPGTAPDEVTPTETAPAEVTPAQRLPDGEEVAAAAGEGPEEETTGRPAGEGLSPELIAQALRGAIQRKLAEVGLIAGEDGAVEATGEAVEQLRAGAKRVAVNLVGDLSAQLQRLADGALRPGGPKGGAAMARALRPEDEAESNVVDLDAARRARGPGPLAEAEQRIAGALRESFNRYLLEHAPPAEDGVPGHVTIDGAFIREHGGRLLASLFGSFASAVLPPSVGVDAGEGAEAGAAEQRPVEGGSDAAEGASDTVEAQEARVVSVKLDLPGLFRDLMPPPPK